MSSFIERFAIGGAAAVVGLTVVLGIFGFLSLLGADPDEPLGEARSVEEVTPGGDTAIRSRATPGERAPGSVGPGEEAVRPSPALGPQPTARPLVAVLAVVKPGERTPTPAPVQRGGTPTPARAPTTAPTPRATSIVTPAPTPVPTPQPEPCSTSGTPVLRLYGKHVRI